MGSVSTRGAAALAVLLLVIVGASSVVDADCQNELMALAPCYPAATTSGGNPTDSCCKTLKDLGMPCLCTTLSQYANALPSSVNVQQVLTLPGKCAVPGHAGYSCAGYTVPP